MTASELRMQLRMQQERNAVVAGYATPDDADATLCNQKAHRHWMIYFPDREPVEVVFAPGIEHKTVRLVYPKATDAEPITDELDGNI